MPSSPELSSLYDVLRLALGDNISNTAKNFIDLFAEDVLFEFPYAPPEGVQALHGKTELAEYLPKVGKLISIESLSLNRVILSEDKTSAVLEFTCKGVGTETDFRYDQTYISVVDITNKLISRYRDYWNPLIVLSATGGLESMSKTLKGN
ncbi:nuclear transport factor 2 family protein [Pseudoalteromonas mariniglutinosa]|uniref:nuclear transport factor 2 family protein n=1 Tax=Pseudoalteromonas mariniglutinosa TaxID=206042 RepID=UPI00384CE5A1